MKLERCIFLLSVDKPENTPFIFKRWIMELVMSNFTIGGSIGRMIALILAGSMYLISFTSSYGGKFWYTGTLELNHLELYLDYH